MHEETESRAEWRDQFIRSRDVREVGAQSRHYRDAAVGSLWRVARGAYLPGAPPADDDERYLALVRGRSIVARNSPVFSHYSAARMWGLPIFDRWPETVHIEVGNSRNGRSIPGLRRHRSDSIGRVCVRGGVRVTSLARTVADVAASSSLRTAVVIIDAALAGLADSTGQWLRVPLPSHELFAEIERRFSNRGSAQLKWAARFGNGLSGSPGESVSRLSMHQIGCPPPVLQQTFWSDGAFVATTDFWWPDYNVAGEFDGRGKYLREELTRGKSTGQVVIAEKRREDKLRSLGPSMIRWMWEEAVSLRSLRATLTRAGLPCSN